MTGQQILAQNLLYDISQIAIPWDRVDNEYLQAPKLWNSFGKDQLPGPRQILTIASICSRAAGILISRSFRLTVMN